jgi:hypothetical protein
MGAHPSPSGLVVGPVAPQVPNRLIFYNVSHLPTRIILNHMFRSV